MTWQRLGCIPSCRLGGMIRRNRHCLFDPGPDVLLLVAATMLVASGGLRPGGTYRSNLRLEGEASRPDTPGPLATRASGGPRLSWAALIDRIGAG
jgi:hypothetical protein